MPKDTREILSGVRHKGTVYVSGQEDELAAAVSPAELARLEEKGAIVGFAKVKTEPETPPKKDKK